MDEMEQMTKEQLIKELKDAEETLDCYREDTRELREKCAKLQRERDTLMGALEIVMKQNAKLTEEIRLLK